MERPGDGADGYIPQIGTASRSSCEAKHLVVIDQVIAWWVMNPGKSIAKASHKQGGPIEFSELWLRMLVSTDAFRARLAEKQKEHDAALLIPQLREKLHAVTEAAVERLGDMIPVATDSQFVLDATEMLLKTHYQLDAKPGNTPAALPTIQVDHATIIMQQERERMLSPRQKGEVIDVDPQEQRALGHLGSPRFDAEHEAPLAEADLLRREEPTESGGSPRSVSPGEERTAGAARDVESGRAGEILVLDGDGQGVHQGGSGSPGEDARA